MVVFVVEVVRTVVVEGCIVVVDSVTIGTVDDSYSSEVLTLVVSGSSLAVVVSVSAFSVVEIVVSVFVVSVCVVSVSVVSNSVEEDVSSVESVVVSVESVVVSVGSAVVGDVSPTSSDVVAEFSVEVDVVNGPLVTGSIGSGSIS